MKLYKTTCQSEDGLQKFCKFTSSADGASRARIRLKKIGMRNVKTEEVEVATDRTSLIAFLNALGGHESATP